MFAKPPFLVKKLFSYLVWDIDTDKKNVFLTFDDGPHPEITTQVLNILAEYNVKATFFCVGENVQKYPDTFKLIMSKGHSVGNHSYNHLNGWKTKKSEYLNNVEQANTLIKSSIFRPPYGRITPIQIKALKKKYRIIMWSVLTYDFDSEVSKQQCYNNSIKHVSPGSIVVFHDSVKAANNMLFALPLFIQQMLKDGWIFKTLSYTQLNIN